MPKTAALLAAAASVGPGPMMSFHAVKSDGASHTAALTAHN